MQSVAKSLKPSHADKYDSRWEKPSGHPVDRDLNGLSSQKYHLPNCLPVSHTAAMFPSGVLWIHAVIGMILLSI